MMREKFIHAHMKAAEVYSKLSSAKRLQVGCVIVKNDTIIGIGYNGMPSGWTNECEDVIPEKVDPYTRTVTPEQLVTKREVLHAETNAIAKVARSTNSSKDSILFVTHSPCVDCAKLIHQAGIKRVYYKYPYRSDDGVYFLKKCGIYVEKVKE